MESSNPLPAADPGLSSPAKPLQLPKNQGAILLALLLLLPIILAVVHLLRRQQQGDAGEVPLTPVAVEAPVVGDLVLPPPNL